MSCILIFDLETEGHHSDYLLSLIQYLAKSDNGKTYVIVTDSRFETHYREFQTKYLTNSPRNFSIDYVNSRDLAISKQLPLKKRSLWEWELYIQKLREHNATSGILMYFDLFQWGIFKGTPNPIPTAGILFRAKIGGNYNFNLRDKIKNWIAHQILKSSLKRASINQLFLLDKYAIQKYGNDLKRIKITHLADPIMQFKELNRTEKDELKSLLSIKANQKVYLIFGFLDERKGIEQTINALQQMPIEEQSKITLLIAGPVALNFKSYVSTIDANKLAFNIILKNQEFRNEDIQHLFEISDLILALYQNHVGMSSVVVRAAISRKPIIAANYGMMGRYVKDHKLGAVVDAANTKQIAHFFSDFLRGNIIADENLQSEVAKSNSADTFAETILSFNS